MSSDERDEQTNKFIQLRKSAKGSLTRIKNFVNNFNSESDKIEQLTARYAQLDIIWTKYDQNQSALEEINEEEYAEDRDAFENSYLDVKAKIEGLKNRVKVLQSALQDESQQSTVNQLDSIKNVKLPDIKLPSFSGQYEEWRSFIDIFDSMIHENSLIPVVQKFYYLKLSLSGDAASDVQALKPTVENYEYARKILFETYDKKQYIIDAHLTSLCSATCNSKQDLKSFLSSVKQHINALHSLRLKDSELWQQTLIFIIKQKLDFSVKQQWELNNTDKDILPNLENFLKFLDQRCYANKSANIKIAQTDKRSHRFHTHVATNNNTLTKSENNKMGECGLCKEKHKIYNCNRFLTQTVDERIATIKSLKLCFNCLRKGHISSDCQSQRCKHCKKKHNSLIHQSLENHTETTSTQEHSTPVVQQITHVSHSSRLLNTSQILLGTAIILVQDSSNNWRQCRVLLDSGSQSNFVNHSFLRKLNCETKAAQISIFGVNQTQTAANFRANIYIKSRFNDTVRKLSFISLERITTKLPTQPLNKHLWNLPNVELADPEFDVPRDIDMLIGAEIYLDILRLDQIKLGDKLPVLQSTEFGWIIAGPVDCQVTDNPVCCFTSSAQLEAQLVKFWKLEELTDKTKLTIDERVAEEHFSSTHKRNENGRFVVTLPKKLDPKLLGESHSTAMKRFLALETRLNRDNNLKQHYTNFIKEYQKLGHMEKASDEIVKNSPTYFLPHHAVVKDTSITTRVRVVFDGSSKSSSGLALNDILMVGPTIQDDITELLIRFRKHKYVLTSDIVKMYRQVMVTEEDTNLQLILWREHPQDDIDIFKLKTVTYGTASAPFLAIRSLQELAKEAPNETVRNVILQDFYVDDLITGADSITQLQTIRNDLISLLEKGGFKLNKWASNHKALVEGIAEKSGASIIIFDKTCNIKTLGLLWNAFEDTFYFQVPDIDQRTSTKRSVLATIAKIFDPIGLISPIIVAAKVIMQQLWELHIGWDDEIPQKLKVVWEEFCKQLPILNEVQIPRYLMIDNPIMIEIHGFADASEIAYGACVYMRSINNDGKIVTRLIASKSRVAPLKRITIPRLELCAALLLARLYKKVLISFKCFTPDETYLWSDSTIVLCWLKKVSRSFKTFVSVRVAEIQELTVGCEWRYVSSVHNPADIVSRGADASELLRSELWWAGPPWLSSAARDWPTQPKVIADEETTKSELRIDVCCTALIREPFLPLTKYSDFNKLQRVFAYCKRFYHNSKFPDKKRTHELTSMELHEAVESIIGSIQRETFAKEIKQLQNHHAIDNNSKLKTLNPFLDEKGLLRVGGRLQNSSLSVDEKFPVILPYDHHVTEIIVNYEHQRLLHCGHEQLLATLRRKYWILSGRRLVKKVIHQCIKCFKVNPTPMSHSMGNLPSHRVTATDRPFLHCGVDYAGPMQLKESHRRGRIHTTKAYVALFVCFATKAVHIEVVSDLTTDCFIAALKRFIGRRGLCRNMYSDNGTTFVGANNKLKEMYHFLSNHQTNISAYLSQHRIDWHFIPAKSPHFGGLWESAIKSMKRHLYRTNQNTVLTYEELVTLMIGIESCLNSRPLTPCSSDARDLNVLTPAHFLIGDILVEPTEPDLSLVSKPLKSRWDQLTRLRQQYWKRWNHEYLQQLQARNKWYFQRENIKTGMLVLLMDERHPPLQWITGRLEELYPGPDGVVRVVTVRTSKGVFKRSIRKLCALPLED